MITLTPFQVRKIKTAIAECDAYIQRESKRSADLRPISTQKMLDYMINHRARLYGMLETNTIPA